MFTYLHCYLPETWEGQVRAGLIREGDGIRFCQSIDIPEEHKFNRLARKGGEMWKIVEQRRCPLYIDRLQGGCYIENYPYDMDLVNAYRELLGDKFWGFQMHEWSSNLSTDIARVRPSSPWTAEGITREVLRQLPYPHPMLQTFTPEEFAARKLPENLDEFLAFGEELFRLRQSYTGGDLLPCDSYHLAGLAEMGNGAKRLMPEIGKQTPDTRIQVAYSRGMTAACGKPFGTYYEPWGGKPFSACCYHKDGENEWNIHSGADFPYETKGATGGSSRSLQRRLHLYSYMAGASFMAEEWGMCNVFYDWKDFELTPYGEVKLEFQKFVDKYPDIGTPVVPGAVVLPDELPILQTLREKEDVYCGYPVEGARAESLRRVRAGLRVLFRQGYEMLGTETENLRNDRLPDGLDIVHESFLKPERYAFLVDLTGGRVAKAHPGKVISPEEAEQRLWAELPYRAEGPALKQCTRRADGKCYLMLQNESGVERTVEQGDHLIAEAESCIVVTCRDGRSLTMLEGNAGIHRREDGAYAVTIPAGGWFFGEL